MEISKEIFERKRWLTSLITENFAPFNLSRTNKRKLQEIVINAFSRSILDDVASGLVIAGFGEKEFTPSVAAYEIEGIVRFKKNRRYIEILKYTEDVDKSHCGRETKAGIVPFAQEDMVAVFISGMHPFLDDAMERILNRLCSDFAEKIVEQLGNRLLKNEMVSVKKTLLDYGKELVNQFTDGISDIQRKKLVNPTIRSLSRLSKEDLASLAEALVHLTSLKRKVSYYPETVSDPVDVAVISKGDGLIWMKRKHYFAAELNPNYFLKRSKEVTDGDK